MSGDEQEGHAVRNALEVVLAEYGVFATKYGPEEHGSWWQRMKFEFQRAFKTEVVQRHLAEVEYRLQIELVEKAAAEVNKVKSDAAAELIKAIDKSEKAVVIFGQTVVVKFDGTMIVRSVDPMTAAKIERTDALLSDPEAVVRMLSQVSNETVSASAAPPELEGGEQGGGYL